MKRREFVVGVAGAAAWSLAARAQNSAKRVIGFLNGQSPHTFAHLVAAVRGGLKQTGHIEVDNLLIKYRWAEGEYGKLPILAADLVRQQVALIVTGGTPAAAI